MPAEKGPSLEKDPSLELLKLINEAITIIEEIEGTSNDQKRFNLFLKTKIGTLTMSGQNNANVTHLTEINSRINNSTDEDGYTKKTVGELKTIISTQNLSNTVSTLETQDNNELENFRSLSHDFFKRMSEGKGYSNKWFSFLHRKPYKKAGKNALNKINTMNSSDANQIANVLYESHELIIEAMKKNDSQRTWHIYQQTFFSSEKRDNRHINSTERNIDEIFKQSKQDSAKKIIMGNNK